MATSSYNSPSLPALITQIQGDIDSRLAGANSAVRQRILNAISYALGGAMSGEYDELEWLARQLIPHLSDDAFLLRWAAFFGVPRKQESAASGPLSVTVSEALTIPTGTQWQRTDGLIYESTADAVATTGGALIVQAQSLTKGATSNASAGTKITLVSPIAGVQPVGAVGEDDMTGGADQEAIEQLRSRLLLRVQYPPQGGTKWDYERWAREVHGVMMAWCFPKWDGPGTVGVTFVLDGEGAAMFPGPADVTRVADYIAEHEDPLTGQPVGQPLGPVVTVWASKSKTVDFTIKLTPNTAAVQAAVQTELAALFGAEGAPNSSISLSHMREAISRASGEEDNDLVEPSAPVVTGTDEVAVPGGYTWL